MSTKRRGRKARRSRRRELNRKPSGTDRYHYIRSSMLDNIHRWFKRASRQHSRTVAKRQLRDGDHSGVLHETRLDPWGYD